VTTTADVAPFRAAIRAGVPLIMASHALYPALDPDHIASQSPAILGGLLRRRLGFRGAVITDSLEARAVLARSSVATAAVRSLRAGADLVLLTGPGSYPSVYRRLLALARRSPAFRVRLRDAYARARTVIGRP
jgi:beta-N-acetylhexosaminidase